MKQYLFPSALIVSAIVGGSTSSAQPKPQTVKLLEDTKFEIKRHIHSVAFSPDGKVLAVGEENVHLYDVGGDAPKEIAVLKSRVGFGIHSMVFSPNGKRLALGGADHSVRLWDVDEQKELFRSKDHRGSVRSVTFAPEGKILASGSDDRTTILWDVGDEGKLVERAVVKAEDKFGADVRSVVFTQKGKTLVMVTGASNGTFRSYTVGPAAVKQVGGFKAKHGFGEVSVRSSPTGKLWAISDHKQVHLLDSAGTAVGVLEGHKENVADVAFSPDGKLLASAGRDGTLHVWSVAARVTRITKDRPGKFTCVAWAPGGEGTTDMKLAAALEDGTVWLLKVGYR